MLKVVEGGASKFHPLYELEMSMKSKIDVIAREIYRADRVVYGGEAQTALRRIEKLGLGQPAGVHGQDAVQLQRRPDAAQRARATSRSR